MTALALRYQAIVEATLQLETEEARRRGQEESDSKPRAPAATARIAEAEAARGAPFPESYRTFLRTYDGWERFAWSLSLFGTTELLGDEYEAAAEVFTYGDEPIPDELQTALLVGCSDHGPERVLLLASGEVVEWQYEEEQRHPDLATYLETRQHTLLGLREHARICAKRTESEWEPERRRAEEAALAVELARVLADAARTVSPARELPTRVLEPAVEAVEPAELVLGDQETTTAYVGLGVVLYLGAVPSKDEVLGTWRAFRRHFPVQGTLVWQLASALPMSSEESDDADSEPFADRLRVDDEGHFGIRTEVVAEGHEGGIWLLNVRGIPPEEVHDETGEHLVPRASFVELAVPPHGDPRAVEAFCHELVDLLPVRSGHGGWFVQVRNGQPDPYATVLSWCRRFFALDLGIDGWLTAARHRHRGAGWLTVLGTPFVHALAEPLSRLDATITRHDGIHGSVLRAGAIPTLGDVARGEFPEAIARVARMLEPVTVSRFATRSTFSTGGIWFSTSSHELPGAFGAHHLTLAHARRFLDPLAFTGPSPREIAIELTERLLAAAKKHSPNDWPSIKAEGDFGDVLRTLYNASTGVTTTPAAVEALEHAARYPDVAPAQVYNNLLFAYLHTKETDKALALLPVALRTAEANAATYHNAACVYVRASRLDDALDCVRRAKAAGYQHLARMQNDDDLAPLFGNAEFQQLFVAPSE